MLLLLDLFLGTLVLDLLLGTEHIVLLVANELSERSLASKLLALWTPTFVHHAGLRHQIGLEGRIPGELFLFICYFIHLSFLNLFLLLLFILFIP